MRLETTLTDDDPELSHPDWFHVRECLRERRFDSRWSTELVAAFSGGELIAAMPVSTCRGSVIPDANLRLELHRNGSAVKPPDVMFLGGHAYLRGGVSLNPAIPAGETGAVVSAVTRWGLDAARSRCLVPHALFVADDQLAPMAAAWQPRPRMCQAPPIAFIPVRRCADLNAFAATLPRSARHYWQEDMHRLRSLGIDAETVAVTEDLLVEAAPGIAAVKIRNGVADHPRLTAIRLRSWFSGVNLSLTRAWAVRSRDGDLLGFSLGVVDRGVLRLIEIGLAHTHELRREIYLALAFHAPARACLAESLAGMDLGPGSLQSKRRRGAVLLRQWHLL